MSSSFFAMLARMKYITRWGLMKNTRSENLSEHTLEVTMLAHLLALLRNERFGGSVPVEQVVLAALYHDCSEILTGDLPTPIKYHNDEIKSAYKQIEEQAALRLAALLPEDLCSHYAPLLEEAQDMQVRQLVKAADKLSALLKCTEELASGNPEFTQARESTLRALHAMELPEVETFLQEFLPAYSLTLDELDLGGAALPPR